MISTNPRLCKVAILGVESTSLKETFKGTIRKEDVRATEKDKVEMYKSFRPGDILVGRVLTLHTQTYLLSTAENELGVVFAKSEAGKSQRISKEFLCLNFPKCSRKFPNNYCSVLMKSLQATVHQCMELSSISSSLFSICCLFLPYFL